MPSDGSYYAKGRSVYRSPNRTERGYSMGFLVCTLADGVSDDGAQEIADALNEKQEREKMNAILTANREGQEA